MIIDTHSHLYLEQFNEDIDDVISRSKEAGVQNILLPNIDLESINPMRKLYQKDPDYFSMALGLHPTSVGSDYENELNSVLKEFNSDDFVAIGEIGIDLYWDKTFFKQQQDVLDIQLTLAIENDLPVIIHSRNSFDEIIDVMNPHFRKGVRGVFHCFPGDHKQARYVVDNGFYIGIGGVLTYKKSNMTEVIENIPIERILLETDAPYLSPVPKRGKRNEPGYLYYIVDKMSEILDVDRDEICHQTTVNAKELFGL